MISVVVQSRLDADRHPDPDKTFHFDADLDPDIHMLDIRIFLLSFTAELVYLAASFLSAS
jgi:hypothetical protein